MNRLFRVGIIAWRVDDGDPHANAFLRFERRPLVESVAQDLGVDALHALELLE